jgi:hypothetical protein
MDFKQTLTSLTKREMTRKEFLASAGAAALAVVGVSTVLKALDQTTNRSASQGYGASAYGGGPSSRGTSAAPAPRPRV